MPFSNLNANYELELDLPWTVDPRVLPNNQVSTVANRCYYFRVTRGRNRIGSIAIPIAVQSGNVSVAVFRNTGTGISARPANRVATSGVVACGAPGRQTLVLDAPVNVAAGDWFCIATDNGVIRIEGVTSGVLGYDGLTAWQDAAMPPPTNATPINTSAGRTIALIGVPA